MILIGQYDSSFVRRVGIALRLYDMPFEHRPWSVFGDAEQIRKFNPLVRVPTLVLEDGEVLVDSTSILDYLDHLAGPERALYPQRQPERHRAMAVTALASGLADKTVSLFYEQRLHDQISEPWAERCRQQIVGTLDVLERRCSERSGVYWFQDRITHADIAVAASLRHMLASHPELVSMEQYPALRDHAAWFEAMPVFQEIYQPFVAPA